jgi:hypothetical protein
MISIGVITNYTTISQSVQIDGRSWVVNSFTDQVGIIYTQTYLASIGENISNTLQTQATALSASLIANEIANNVAAVESLGASAVYTLNYSTQAANDLAVRQAFLNATGIIAVNIGAFLNTIGAGRLTAAFSLANVISLMSLLSSLNTTAVSVNAAKGQ